MEKPEWFYLKDGEKAGPLPWSQLRQLAASSKLRPTDHVWKEGMPSWSAANSVAHLFPAPLAASSPSVVPPAPAATPASPPDAPGPAGKIVNLLNQANDLWRKLTLLQRICVIAVAALVVVLFLVSTVIKATGGGEQGTSLWQVLMDLGVVSGTVGLAFGLLQKYLEKKLFFEAPAAASSVGTIDERAPMGYTPKIEAGPGFMGLSAHQWLVTLHIVFLAGLAGTIVAGFLLGASSLWVNGTALAVIGGLIAFLSVWVAFAYDKQLRKEGRTAASHIAFELKMSVILGLSALPVGPIWLVLSWVLAGITQLHWKFPFGSVAIWMYLVYGAALLLPEIHVLVALARCMRPISKSAGLWISGAYLIGMFALCAVIAITTIHAPTYSPYADKIIGKWVIEDESGTGTTVEFTRGGQAIVSNWFSFDSGTEHYKYRFTDSNHIVLFVEGKDEDYEYGDLEMLSENEFVLTLHADTKKFRQHNSRQ